MFAHFPSILVVLKPLCKYLEEIENLPYLVQENPMRLRYALSVVSRFIVADIRLFDLCLCDCLCNHL